MTGVMYVRRCKHTGAVAKYGEGLGSFHSRFVATVELGWDGSRGRKGQSGQGKWEEEEEGVG